MENRKSGEALRQKGRGLQDCLSGILDGDAKAAMQHLASGKGIKDIEKVLLDMTGIAFRYRSRVNLVAAIRLKSDSVVLDGRVLEE